MYGNSVSSEFVNPDYNDAAWLPVPVLMLQKGETFWVRCAVQWDRKAGGDLMIRLGLLNATDETWLNGLFVGATGGSRRNLSRLLNSVIRSYHYPAPAEESPDTGLLAVKLTAVQPIRIDLRDFRVSRTSKSDSPVFGQATIPVGFSLLLVLLLTALRREFKDQKLLRRSLLPLGVTLSLHLYLNTFHAHKVLYDWFTTILKFHVIVTALTVVHSLKLAEYFLGRDQHRRLWFIFLIFGGFVLLLPGWDADLRNAQKVLYSLIGILLLAAAYGCALGVQIYSRIRKDKLLVPVIAMGLGIFIPGAVDVVNMITAKPVLVPASGIGFLFFYATAIMTVLLREMREKQNKIDRLELDQELGKLASQVAHDIRSPLAALDATLGTLQQLPEEKRMIIRSAVGRIRDIANNLVRQHQKTSLLLPTSPNPPAPAARATTPTEELSTELLSGHIETLISEKRMQFRSRLGVELESRLGRESYGVFAKVHPTELKRLLSNLIDNAYDALASQGQIQLQLVAQNNKAILTVSDNGPGIPQELLLKLGERGVTFGKKDGSGLGLFHARSVLHTWGGELRIESTPGRGTSVSAVLPKVEAPQWFVEKVLIPKGGILVAFDDDASIHQIWRGRLESIRAHEAGVTALHFSTPKDLKHWVLSSPAEVERATFLIDYEIVGTAETGLDLIDALAISKQSILVTSRFEEKAIFQQSARLGIRMLPKGLAGFVPMEIQ